MTKGKRTKFEIELNDGIGVADALQILQNALKEIDTKVEHGDGYLEWDISKNVPGYSVKMRDVGVDCPKQFIIGKANRACRKTTGDKTA